MTLIALILSRLTLIALIAKRLERIWGSAADDIYAVGTGGTLIHFDGTEWKARITVPPSDTSFSDISGSGRDAIAVGFDGSIWRIGPPAI